MLMVAGLIEQLAIEYAEPCVRSSCAPVQQVGNEAFTKQETWKVQGLTNTRKEPKT